MLHHLDLKIDIATVVHPNDPPTHQFCGIEYKYRIVVHKYCAEVHYQELLARYFNSMSEKCKLDTNVYEDEYFYPYPNQMFAIPLYYRPSLYSIKTGNMGNFIIENTPGCVNINADIRLIERDIFRKIWHPCVK